VARFGRDVLRIKEVNRGVCSISAFNGHPSSIVGAECGSKSSQAIRSLTEPHGSRPTDLAASATFLISSRPAA